MAKKTKKMNINDSLTILNKLPNNEGERLQFMINMTKKSIGDKIIDDHLNAQLERLKLRLKEWKSLNK